MAPASAAPPDRQPLAPTHGRDVGVPGAQGRREAAPLERLPLAGSSLGASLQCLFQNHASEESVAHVFTPVVSLPTEIRPSGFTTIILSEEELTVLRDVVFFVCFA